MKHFFHPSIDKVTLEGILYALSDPLRLSIFCFLVGKNEGVNCCTFLEIAPKAVPKSTLSQHIRILRDNGLIKSEPRGVELINTTRYSEINKKFPGLLDSIIKARKQSS